MHVPAAALRRTPYGLSFAVEDLVTLRQWAASRGLCMTVALDQVLDEGEFEEMAIVAAPHRRRRTLTVWRTASGFFLQPADGKTRAFASLAEGLAALKPKRAPRKAWWRVLIGWAGRHPAGE